MSRRRPNTTRAPRLSFRAFLSHRYKSPEVNLYFFGLFAETSEVQFEVDEGTTFTSVTRLERMIRDADAFIGIYPFPGSREDARSAEKLRDASKYFRLELDLAVRSRKPAVVFYDERYGDWVKPPAGIMSAVFNAQEVEGAGGFPRADMHRKIFRGFCELVDARRAYDVARAGAARDGTGVIVPTGTDSYTRSHVNAIRDTLTACGCQDVRVLKWPPVLNRETFSALRELDIVCVDVGPQTAATGMPAYLHGSFIPSIRMRKGGGDAGASPLERALYGAVEVGYRKDLLVWEDARALRAGIRQKVSRLKDEGRLIGTAAEAEKYFRGAALRKEHVFLSYSGDDEEIAAELTVELKKRFQKVFNYRDKGESIPPGSNWLDEIYDQLSSSAVGIPLLSRSYLKSKNCLHEARQMVAQKDDGKLLLLPLKIEPGKLDSPIWMQDTQYLRYSEYDDDPASVARRVQARVEVWAEKPKGTA